MRSGRSARVSARRRAGAIIRQFACAIRPSARIPLCLGLFPLPCYCHRRRCVRRGRRHGAIRNIDHAPVVLWRRRAQAPRGLRSRGVADRRPARRARPSQCAARLERFRFGRDCRSRDDRGVRGARHAPTKPGQAGRFLSYRLVSRVRNGPRGRAIAAPEGEAARQQGQRAGRPHQRGMDAQPVRDRGRRAVRQLHDAGRGVG